MSEGTSLWLRLVLRAERAIGTRVETAVHSDPYFDLVALFNRQKATLTDSIEGVSERILHLANLPAGTDVRRVREQLARMERRLVEVSKELDDQRDERELQR
jgi:hypothetical protein